jgi:GT2 family glycosyltransferase
MKKTSVFVCTFSSWERDGWPCTGLSVWLGELGVMRARGEREVQRHGLNNARPHDHARNRAVQAFLESGLEWLLMVDNDMVPQADLLTMLDYAAAEADTVVPKFYCLSGNDPSVLRINLAWKLLPGQTSIPANVSWVELAGAGTGCIAVRRRAFEKLEKPYFKFGYDANGFTIEGEDEYFSRTARAAGLRIFGNTAFECDHLHTISLSALARLIERAKP